MFISLLGASFAREGFAGSKSRGLIGLGLDVLMIIVTVVISLTYLIEHDQVCLIDQISGERERFWQLMPNEQKSIWKPSVQLLSRSSQIAK